MSSAHFLRSFLARGIALAIVAAAGCSLEAVAGSRDKWFAAANAGDANILATRLSAERGLLDAKDEYNQSALQIAARLGFYDAAKLLLDEGAALEQVANFSPHVPVAPFDGKHEFMGYGATPLGLAVQFNHVDIANLLLDRGANPRAEDKGGRNLLFQVCSGPLAGRLVAAGLDPNRPPSKLPYGNAFGTPSALGHAVQCRDSDAARVLIEAGADVNHVGNMRTTVLHVALQSRAPLETIRLLIDAGASIEAPAAGGQTPLMFAAEFSDDPQIVALLLERGAKVDARNERGATAVNVVRGASAEAKRSILNGAMDKIRSAVVK